MTAFAPATVSNVACGFDVLGFALNAPGDEVTARLLGGRESFAVSASAGSTGSASASTQKLQTTPDPQSRRTVIFVTHDLEEAIALADEVVVLSAGPASHIVARHPVTLDRPRDLMELRTAPPFIELYRALWVVLREEVIKSQQTTGAARG